jgi:hypothetical protein
MGKKANPQPEELAPTANEQQPCNDTVRLDSAINVAPNNDIPPLTAEEIMMFRKFINCLFSNHSGSANTCIGENGIVKEVEKIVYQEKIVEKPVEVIKTIVQEKIVEKPDPIRSELASMFELLAIVRQDSDFNRLWLADCEQESMAMIQLTAKLSQWETLEQLWDSLKSRCSNDKRPLTDKESTILNMTLSLVNLTSERKSSLQRVEPRTSYDYEHHQSVQKTGERILDTWLPALLNPAGVVVKKPLVQRG